MNPFTDIVAYTNTLPAFIQGLPLATIQNHEVRMLPSPVSSDLAWLHIHESDPNDYDKYARAAYIVISDNTALKPRPASGGVFVDDPDCLHMSNLKDPNSVVRDAIHDQLDALTRSGFVKNHDYKKIFKRGWYERERRKHTVAHASAKYFFPRCASAHYQRNVPAMIMNKLSKFSSRSTAVYFCHIAEDISKDYKTRGREKHRGVKLECPLVVEPRVRALQTSQNVTDIPFLSRWNKSIYEPLIKTSWGLQVSSLY